MPTATTKKPGELLDLELLARQCSDAVAAARDAMSRLGDSGVRLMERVAQAAALGRSDRRGRISAAAHIERCVRLSGVKADAVDRLERDLAEHPHLFVTTEKAIHHTSTTLIAEPGYWRNGGWPEQMDALARAMTEYDLERFTALIGELASRQYNAFIATALAFRLAAAKRPELFGTASREEAHAEAIAANELVESAARTLRQEKALVEVLCERYGVVRRPGTDPWPDLLDAAVAEHTRGRR